MLTHSPHSGASTMNKWWQTWTECVGKTGQNIPQLRQLLAQPTRIPSQFPLRLLQSTARPLSCPCLKKDWQARIVRAQAQTLSLQRSATKAAPLHTRPLPNKGKPRRKSGTSMGTWIATGSSPFPIPPSWWCRSRNPVLSRGISSTIRRPRNCWTNIKIIRWARPKLRRICNR